jgi:hypothetical protein
LQPGRSAAERHRRPGDPGRFLKASAAKDATTR